MRARGTNAGYGPAVLDETLWISRKARTDEGRLSCGGTAREVSQGAGRGLGVAVGVLEALFLQVGAASKSMTRPADTFDRANPQRHLIINPMPAVDAAIAVPREPS